ncbi:MAG: DUF167 domain-containing protein [Planctomycetota bacterium]
MIVVRETSHGVSFAVKAKPAAKVNGITGEHDGALRVSVTAPPEQGKANDAIVRLLADSLEIKRSQIEIIKGHSSAQKSVQVVGHSADEIRERIAGLLSRT